MPNRPVYKLGYTPRSNEAEGTVMGTWRDRLLPLESVEATESLLGTPSFNDFRRSRRSPPLDERISRGMT